MKITTVSKVSYCILFIGIVFAIYFAKNHQRSITSQQQKVFNIAVITAESNYHTPATVCFIKAAKEAGNDHYNFKTETFITEIHNKILTTSISETILEKSFDLVVTIGAGQSTIFHAVNKKRKKLIPQVCIGAAKMIESGLITSNEKPGGNVTGVSGTPQTPLLAFKVFRYLKPHAKKILIPYCPHSSQGEVEKNALLTADEAKKCGIEVTLLAFEKTSEAIQKIRHIIEQGFDTVFCLEGDVINDIDCGIGKICSQHNVTFFSGALDSMKESSAAGFGIDSGLTGTEAFEYVWRILVNGENPGDLPIKFVDNARRVAINKKLCAEQDLPILPIIELCLSRGIVYS